MPLARSSHRDLSIPIPATMRRSPGRFDFAVLLERLTTAMVGTAASAAPCKPDERDLLVKLMEGVEDIPEVVLTGLPWNWELRRLHGLA